ncbi:hypothetical protein SAMN04488109_0825 [Chryseolinea serpens]|uniref:Uncharacterized protein n=1 Tax=Chryseolinea serpens TaxID=947013 RepID=A0A1M5KTX3_9BACT|nr:hypothetical protein [Chryseolinea serpens]SHG55969.1 hypothetical protein SAMN04488109_0825 [Chryseolinea serpens]
MKALLIFGILSLAAFSCNKRGNPPFEETPEVDAKLKKYILDGLRRYNSVEPPTDIGIWIRPVSVVRNNNAVYNFGEVSTHSSRRNLFLYDGGDIEILSEEGQIDALNKFFNENDFLPGERSDCLRQIIEIVNEDTSVTF